MRLYLIQEFDGEVWLTVGVTSDQEHSDGAFQRRRVAHEFVGDMGIRFRQIQFDVPDFGFISAHATNFAVLDKINF